MVQLISFLVLVGKWTFCLGFPTLLACLIYTICWPYHRQRQYDQRFVRYQKTNSKLKQVPIAPNCLPLVGHGLAFSQDIYGYVKKNYNQLGKVFRLQIFRSEILVVCDRELIAEYFRGREANMSLYDALKRIYFGHAFSDNKDNLDVIIKLVKSTVRINDTVFIPKINFEARQMIDRLKTRVRDNGGQLNCKMKSELIRFVARTSAKCFISVDMTEQFFDQLMEFTDLLNRLVVLTYFMPHWLIHATLGRKLDHMRHQMTDQLSSTIQLYRDDPTKNDSLVFRQAVDWQDPQTGRRLNNAEVGDIVVCLLYVSSENTALGLNNLLIDMVQHPECAQRVADNTRQALEQNDLRMVFADGYLDNCLMESARNNTHIFPLNRHSRHEENTLGDYYLGDVQCVAICEPILMKDKEVAADNFHEPTKFKPDRFESEKKGPQSIMTWGAGTHLCPGKKFAVMEMKTALSMLLNTFDVQANKVGPLEYFSPSAYAEREFSAQLTLRADPVDLDQSPPSSATGPHVERLIVNDQPVIVVRQALTDYQQKDFYLETVANAVTGPHQLDPLKLLTSNRVPDRVAFPLGWQNLAYTQSSTCRLDFWLKWARKLASTYLTPTELAQMKLDNVPEGGRFDSVYAQLYHHDSQMKSHRDQYVSWGLSVSLGASAQFVLENQLLILHSGDVLICDFSKLTHAVPQILSGTNPSWLNPESYQDDKFDPTFGRVRCSIQIRDLVRTAEQIPQLQSDDQFLEMLIKQ